MFTASCSPSSIAAKFLTGGGPNVAANTQVGKTNTQTLGKTENIAPTVSLKPQSRVDNIDQSVTTNNEVPTSVWIFIGVMFSLWSWFLYILPSPNQIWKKRK